MLALRLFAALGWLALAVVTAHATAALGLGGLVETLVADVAHPWRLQLYLDFELHLILFASWVAWRERPLALGLVCAAATLLTGALFTLPYLLFATVRAEGDVRRLLLGARA